MKAAMIAHARRTVVRECCTYTHFGVGVKENRETTERSFERVIVRADPGIRFLNVVKIFVVRRLKKRRDRCRGGGVGRQYDPCRSSDKTVDANAEKPDSGRNGGAPLSERSSKKNP